MARELGHLDRQPAAARAADPDREHERHPRVSAVQLVVELAIADERVRHAPILGPIPPRSRFLGDPGVSPSGAVGRENPFTVSYRAEWAHFLAVVRGQAPAPSLDEHLTLHRVVEAIYESASKGKDVSVAG